MSRNQGFRTLGHAARRIRASARPSQSPGRSAGTCSAYFEGLDSERAIAWRRMSIRAVVKNATSSGPPDHPCATAHVTSRLGVPDLADPPRRPPCSGTGSAWCDSASTLRQRFGPGRFWARAGSQAVGATMGGRLANRRRSQVQRICRPLQQRRHPPKRRAVSRERCSTHALQRSARIIHALWAR